MNMITQNADQVLESLRSFHSCLIICGLAVDRAFSSGVRRSLTIGKSLARLKLLRSGSGMSRHGLFLAQISSSILSLVDCGAPRKGLLRRKNLRPTFSMPNRILYNNRTSINSKSTSSTVAHHASLPIGLAQTWSLSFGPVWSLLARQLQPIQQCNCFSRQSL